MPSSMQMLLPSGKIANHRAKTKSIAGAKKLLAKRGVKSKDIIFAKMQEDGPTVTSVYWYE